MTLRRLAVLSLLVPSLAPEAPCAEPPNIVLILADDLGQADLACYGHPYAKTPNLDGLAAQGTRFVQAYAPGATCAPSRTGFMTGRWPASFPGSPAEHGFGDRPTVSSLLKRQGYRTGHFGKWHIGPTTAPGTYGFDEIADPGRDGDLEARRYRGRDARAFDAAIDFIGRNRSGPFYVDVWGRVAHHPIDPPEAYLARFSRLTVDRSAFSESMQSAFALCESRGGDVDQAMRQYLGAVASLDDNVGRLLEALDELGLRDQTLVAFASDQGPARAIQPTPAGASPLRRARDNLQLNLLGYAGVLRGHKASNYDGGLRIPFIVRWPGRVPAGRVDETSVISGVDWLPTLLAFTETTVESAAFDGEDASPAWLGRQWTRSRPLFWRRSGHARPVMRDGSWKLHGPAGRRRVELYDLSTDPGETRNVAGEFPEVVSRLTAALEGWVAALPDAGRR